MSQFLTIWLLYTYICTHILLVLLCRIILANAVIEVYSQIQFTDKETFKRFIHHTLSSATTPLKDVTKSHSWRDPKTFSASAWEQ